MKKVTVFFLLMTLLFLYTKVSTISAENTQSGLDTLESQSAPPNTQQGLDTLESQSAPPNTQQGLDTLESQSGSSSSSIKIPVTGLPNPSKGIKGILDNALNWFLGILGTIGIIGFVVSGIMYLVSAGDDDLMNKAKKGMTFSIIGVVVGLSGYIAIKAIDLALNASSTTF